jgi:hypothetical protein
MKSAPHKWQALTCGTFWRRHPQPFSKTEAGRKRRAQRKFTLLASLLCSSAAYAENDHMVYGLGTETCQVALHYDWMKAGEGQWIDGYMSVYALAAPKHEMMPGKDDARPILALVFKQCEAKPFETLAEATDEAATSLLSAQEGAVKGAQRF